MSTLEPAAYLGLSLNIYKRQTHINKRGVVCPNPELLIKAYLNISAGLDVVRVARVHLWSSVEARFLAEDLNISALLRVVRVSGIYFGTGIVLRLLAEDLKEWSSMLKLGFISGFGQFLEDLLGRLRRAWHNWDWTCQS